MGNHRLQRGHRDVHYYDRLRHNRQPESATVRQYRSSRASVARCKNFENFLQKRTVQEAGKKNNFAKQKEIQCLFNIFCSTIFSIV